MGKKKWEGKKQKKRRSLSAVNSIFSKKKIQRDKKKRKQVKRGVVKLRAFIHNLLRENSFRKKNSPPVSSHRQFVYAIEIILTMKSAFLLFRINNLKRKLFRKKNWYSPITWLFVENKKQRFSGKYFGKKEANHKRNFADGSEKKWENEID